MSLSIKFLDVLGHPYEDIGGIAYIDNKIFDPVNDWRDTGIVLEMFTVGSEGASAWGWVLGCCVGKTGDTQQEAIVLTAIAMARLYKARGYKYVPEYFGQCYPFRQSKES